MVTVELLGTKKKMTQSREIKKKHWASWVVNIQHPHLFGNGNSGMRERKVFIYLYVQWKEKNPKLQRKRVWLPFYCSHVLIIIYLYILLISLV